MSGHHTDLVDAVIGYIEVGLAPVPVKHRGKQPLAADWTALRITAADAARYFDPPMNIGILLGEPSGGLVDIDINSPIALQLAPHIMPPTTAKFGRLSKPASHWLYRVPDCGSREALVGHAGTIIELRGNNHFTVFPGSYHESGELIEFVPDADQKLGYSTWGDLEAAARKVAIATELASQWSKGKRHDLALGAAALFAHRGWSREEATKLISVVAQVCNDDDVEDRALAVSTTYARLERNESISDASLDSLIPHSATLIRQWCTGRPRLPVASGGTELVTTAGMAVASDAAAADAFVAEWKGRLIYSNKQWYRRHGDIFEAVPDLVVQGDVKALLQNLSHRAPANAESRNRINAAMELSRAAFHVDPSLVDSDGGVAGCADGDILLLDNRPVESVPPIVTKKLGASLDNVDATCPVWTSFLQQVFQGNQEVIEFVRRAVGYSLTGSCEEQCMFILIGTGANGKSTFLRTVQQVLGDYAGTIPMQTLMVQKMGSQQTNDLASLWGKRFVTASEGEQGERLAEAKIKLMTGGDPITCRALYKDYLTYQPQFKLWLATNTLPQINGTDDAIWRRIHVVEFPVTIPREDRDPKLPDKLMAELPGILIWAVEGLQQWHEQGLNAPEAVKSSTHRYRETSDTVAQWIDVACQVGPGKRATMKELYRSYLEWCDASAIEPLANTEFGKDLARRGFAAKRMRNGTARLGMALRTEDPNTAFDDRS